MSTTSKDDRGGTMMDDMALEHDDRSLAQKDYPKPRKRGHDADSRFNLPVLVNHLPVESDDIKNIVVVGLIRGPGTSKSQLLLVQEPDGTVLFPGGKVKAGEVLAGALRREIREETGLNASKCDIVCIEHASAWEKEPLRMTRSLLLYFFQVQVDASHYDSSHRLRWMGQQEIEHRPEAVPYDNWLIARGISLLEPGKSYVVPPGFKDSPARPGHVAIRIFCWIDEKITKHS